MKLKLYIFTILTLLLLVPGYQPSAEERMTIVINGGMNDNGRVLVPMRAIFEELGATVTWNQQAKTVKATKGDNNIQLTIGSRNVLVNGVQKSIDTTPIVRNGTTLVPLRFISESLGESVKWEKSTRQAVVESQDKLLRITIQTNPNRLVSPDFLKAASHGILQGCNLMLDQGVTAGDIRKYIGGPQSEYWFGGAYYYGYENCGYGLEDDYNQDDLLIAMELFNPNATNETPTVIKQTLGQPVSEGWSELDDDYYMYYPAGDYDIFMFFNSPYQPFYRILLK
ncbi:stalk domain-containing protein [Halalkalibacter urbisdiaboli]|uniref:stalk domain-containing protein n=1 Tax=Halalkalibacter urbisdiaboli TaxID=1960589 RepID=UPI0013FDDFF8|nr:stalk domain-containing protein [Halalkalibacter urbisdiaboli]